ncbi:16S rRNA (guanine(527)-N(7))-methyltransferase RsmG [Paracoccaceae bacterium]|nr:16S rRNA (guanine(527)-N(7))-methyltransferase RsmG [Paracoccaceae bacterium]
MKKNEFVKSLNVSRETLNDFYEYKTLLAKWNEKINLVSKNTLVGIWERHFLDSGQIIKNVEASGKRWVDVGSGAGFPGLVVALLLRDRKINCDLVLVEKNPKKVFFLNEVIRKLKLSVEVVNDNIHTLEPLNADILTARAFSELNNLMEIAFRHRKKEGICLFLKGKNYSIELDKTLNYWFFDYDIVSSLSSSSGKIIRVKKIFKR